MPRFFRDGERGVHATLAYAHRILPVPLAYSILAGLGLYLSAGILPLLLGETYADAVPALQWLAWLPVVSLPRLLLQTLLIGGNRAELCVQHSRRGRHTQYRSKHVADTLMELARCGDGDICGGDCHGTGHVRRRVFPTDKTSYKYI